MRTTVQQIVEQHTGSLSDDQVTDLVHALVQREEEIVGDMATVAFTFGVLPPIFAKVMLDLGLGRPKPVEEAEFITAQYREFEQHIIAEASRTLGLPPEVLGLPPTAPVEEE